MVVDASLFDVGEKLGLGVFEVLFFGENLVRIDGVDLFLVYLCGTKRQGDGGLSFPTADFDDRDFALVELA